jgi:hypothetical protein
MNFPGIIALKKEMKSTGADRNAPAKAGFPDILKASKAKEKEYKQPEKSTITIVTSNADAAVVRTAIAIKSGNAARGTGECIEVPANKPAVEPKKDTKAHDAKNKKEDSDKTPAAAAMTQEKNIAPAQAPAIIQPDASRGQAVQDGNSKSTVKIRLNEQAAQTTATENALSKAETKGSKTQPEQATGPAIDELKIEVKNTGNNDAKNNNSRDTMASKQEPEVKTDEVNPVVFQARPGSVEKLRQDDYAIVSRAGFAHAAVSHVKQVVSSAAAGNAGDGKEYTVTMKITPPDIGEVRIKTVYTQGKEMTVTLTPATQEAAALLDKNINSMKHDLASIFNGTGTQVNVNINNFSGNTASRETAESSDNAYIPAVTGNRYSINSGVNKIALEKNTYLV